MLGITMALPPVQMAVNTVATEQAEVRMIERPEMDIRLFFDKINAERAKEKIGVVKENALLAAAAQAKARDMAKEGYFAHYGPDGKSPWKWIEEAGYKANVAGENLALNAYSAESAVNAWMNSPGHKKNILNSKYTEMGIGYAEGIYEGKSAIFIVQYFGKPVTTKAAVSKNTKTSATAKKAVSLANTSKKVAVLSAKKKL